MARYLGPLIEKTSGPSFAIYPPRDFSGRETSITDGGVLSMPHGPSTAFGGPPPHEIVGRIKSDA
jgi:hypothetical protein